MLLLLLLLRPAPQDELPSAGLLLAPDGES